MNHPIPTLLVSLTLLAAGCSRSHGPVADAPTVPPARVHVTVTRLEPVSAALECTGTVRAAHHAWIAARVMGTIAELPVVLGQRVRSGDVLVRLSAGEIAARLAQTDAQVAYTQRELDRERDLLAKGAGTAESVRGLEDRLRLATAARQEAATMEGYTVLRAPFDGAVSRRLVKAGDLASPGQPLLELEGENGLEIEAMVPESAAATLAVGQQVPALATNLGFSGRITELAASSDPATRTVEARLSVPAGTAVRPGQFVRLLLPSVPSHALLVPASALSLHGQMERVFVIGPDNRAVLRLVRSGRTEGDRVVILSGLKENERVIIAPSATLREGQPLEVLP